MSLLSKTHGTSGGGVTPPTALTNPHFVWPLEMGIFMDNGSLGKILSQTTLPLPTPPHLPSRVPQLSKERCVHFGGDDSFEFNMRPRISVTPTK